MTYILFTNVSNYQFNEAELDPERKKELLEISNSLVILEKFTASILLYDLLKEHYNIDKENISYIYNEFGKPYLKNNPCYFSISHSDGFVCVAVSDEEVGIDIEHVRKVPTLVYEKLFDDDLYDKDKFYKKWTKIEASIKYNGTKISLDLKNIDVSNIDTIILPHDCILSINKTKDLIIKEI